MGMSLSKLWGRVKEREAWGAAVHGVAKSQIMTERLNNNNKGVEATLVCKINHNNHSPFLTIYHSFPGHRPITRLPHPAFQNSFSFIYPKTVYKLKF